MMLPVSLARGLHFYVFSSCKSAPGPLPCAELETWVLLSAWQATQQTTFSSLTFSTKSIMDSSLLQKAGWQTAYVGHSGKGREGSWDDLGHVYTFKNSGWGNGFVVNTWNSVLKRVHFTLCKLCMAQIFIEKIERSESLCYHSVLQVQSQRVWWAVVGLCVFIWNKSALMNFNMF